MAGDRAGLARFERSLTPLLAATALGVYALVIVGATVSATEAASACATWPSCDGRWFVPLDETALAVAMLHRGLSLLVGAALLCTTAVAWAVRADVATRGVLTMAIGLYPIQIGIGAVTATSAEPGVYPLAHLLLAMAIFAGVLLGLVRRLEHETRDVESTFGHAEPMHEADVDEVQETIDDGGPGADPGPVDAANRHSGFAARWGRRALAYGRLTKPRLMWLLCFVALAGMGLAAATTGLAVTTRLVVGTLLGGVLAIGASGTFNHVLERDVDRKMARTADRPTATATVPVLNALTFGTVLAVVSLAVFITLVNVLSAVLGFTAIVFYSVVYTLVLKPNTSQNIVIGGAVGAIPALIGWAAVTGSIGLPAVVLGVLIFLWTPAHFYNLALAYKRDYERGGFPMLPIVRGEAVTFRHIALYFGATLLAAAVLAAVAPLSLWYATSVIVLAGVFLLAIVQLYRTRSHRAAFRSFHASNAFLGVVMVVIILDTLVV